MIRERLWRGDVLRILFADGVGFDVWVEKFGNPPQVFFEGTARPMEEFDDVVAAAERYVRGGGVTVLWNGPIPTKREKPGG
ncbi:MAG: hypothetical protein ACREID_07320 [Planctomycetota bacterium]